MAKFRCVCGEIITTLGDGEPEVVAPNLAVGFQDIVEGELA